MRVAAIPIALSVMLCGQADDALSQRTALHPTIEYAVGKEPTAPIPFFTRNEEANLDVADQLYLHLLTYSPNGFGSTDAAFAPALAHAWHRVDAVTLVLDIDPRARWQDGVAVTAHDVVYSWGLASNPRINADNSQLESIASVEALGERSVRFRFKRASLDQVYTLSVLQPVPAHLLERIPAESIMGSSYAAHPVGDGPFRFERRVPAQLIELRADTAFFLGRPTVDRVLILTVIDATARLNLFLAGNSDILDNISTEDVPALQRDRNARLLPVASNALSYLTLNLRSPADTLRPHPIFGDVRVRQALALALDRETMARVAFGPGAVVPDAAQSQLWSWITPGGIKGTPSNPAQARTLLARAGWRDANGDGILDRNGVPLQFTLTYSTASGPSHPLALQAQQMWRAVGADVRLERIDGSAIGTRVHTGQWDMLIRRVGQDPSLAQSWSCASAQTGGSNVSRWCDTTFDQLMTAAESASDQPAAWRAVLDRMASQFPAIFLAAPASLIAVHRRFDNVVIWPTHPWVSLWQWRVRPGAALGRDR
jgi:peptide/nickel transport system substrate-binding protein